MRRKEFSMKVKNIRDSIIGDIQMLSDDKQNLMSNVKNIKELTSILKELDKMLENDNAEKELEREMAQEDFFENIRKRVELTCEDSD